MQKFFKKARGSIAVFLAIVMLPVLTVAGLVVDGARIAAARTNLANASDLAMNAALSEYDKILYDVYGLFAMSESMEDLEKNVTRYFKNTLNNAGVLADSDSYTREFINSVFSTFGGEQLEFGNVVDITPVSFSLSAPPGSEIGNPAVLERQIVEYMKYRGPFNLGKGLLTKLGCIGETSQQSKVLEAKVDYDKQLGSVQEACEDAYNKIERYNSLVRGDYTGDFKSDFLGAEGKAGYLDQLNSSNRGQLTGYIPEMARYYLAYQYEGRKVIEAMLDDRIRGEVDAYYSDCVYRDDPTPTAHTLDYIALQLSSYVAVDERSSSSPYARNTAFMTQCKELENKPRKTLTKSENFEQQLETVRLYNGLSDIANVKTVYSYLYMYDWYNPSISGKRDTLFNSVKEFLEKASDFCVSYRDEWKSKMVSNGKAAVSLIQTQYKRAMEICNAIDEIIPLLRKIIPKGDDLKTTRDKWSTALNNLSESDIKKSMQGDYENCAKDINDTAIRALIGVFESNRPFFEAVKSALANVKLNGQALKDVNATVGEDAFIAYWHSKLSSVCSSYSSQNVKTIVGRYTDSGLNGYIRGESYAEVDGNGDHQEFYRFLKRSCPKLGTGDNDAKKDAKALKATLIDAGNNKTSEITTLPEKVDLDAALPSDVREAISTLGSDESTEDEFKPYEKDNGMSENNNKEAADTGKSNMGKMSEMLKNLGEIVNNAGERMRDNLYTEEYYTEMFSCYTDYVNQNRTDGKQVVAKTLSGHEMKENPLFGSEAEYILWGNDDVNKNLNNTKAAIFGIRFLLNSIYAFTNADTRTPALTTATAIAGWTGFGVPIVQTVILLAWASAESICDVRALCKGDSVALYKTKDTWKLGYGGLKSKAVDLAKEVATEAVDNVFEKVENLAIDASSNAITAVETSINKFADDTLNGIYESVQGAIAIPVEQVAINLASSFEAQGSQEQQVELIRGKLHEALDHLVDNREGVPLTQQCVNIAVGAIEGDIDAAAQDLANIVSDMDNPEGIVNKINEYLYGKDGESGLIGRLKTTIRINIQGKVNEYGTIFKDQIKEKIEKGGDKVKEEVKDKINSFTAGISGTPGGGDNARSTSAASGFTFSYKEYVKVFILIKTMTGQGSRNAMLRRAAGLIQQNAQKAKSKVEVAKAYTVVQVTSSAEVRTTFFSVPVSTENADGSIAYDLDYSAIGSEKQTVKYKGVLGY